LRSPSLQQKQAQTENVQEIENGTSDEIYINDQAKNYFAKGIHGFFSLN